MNSPQKIFRALAFNPLKNLLHKMNIHNFDNLEKIDQQKTKLIAKDIFSWAKSHGVTHYTFWVQPQNVQSIEKHQAFFELDYKFEGLEEFRSVQKFNHKILQKGEGDGSSIPNGGLRGTEKARAYLAWDSRSDIFIRQGINKTLYIPAMMLTHYGEALDQKTFFRRAEKLLKQSTIKLLQKLGQTNIKNVMFSLGIEQEFFIIKKQEYQSRLDLKMTDRTLYGSLPPRNQQFSQHYYGHINDRIFQIFNQAENTLLKLGVPVKTKHKEVAINQYQISSYFQDATISCDHNILTMQILKSVFQKYGYITSFYQKPFRGANGSGKHCNWSLAYNKNGKYQNLFEPGDNPVQNEKFLLFTLMTLSAVQKNAGLLKASVTTPSNQHRMGGHEAPPCIISVFLGSYVDRALNSFQNGTTFKRQIKDLSDQIPGMGSFIQDNTDRNRTSPFAFTGNKFQFRAAGGKQNVSFSMTVIATALSSEIKEVLKQIESGTSIKQIIMNLIKQTKSIRFEGDGYSKEWQLQAKRRGLPNIKTAKESYDNILRSKLLLQNKIFNENELRGKYNILMNFYEQTKITEAKCLVLIINKIFIPRIIEYLSKIGGLCSHSNQFLNLFKQYEQRYNKCVVYNKKLNKFVQQIRQQQSIQKRSDIANELKQQINQISKFLSDLQNILPQQKNSPPQLIDIFNKY